MVDFANPCDYDSWQRTRLFYWSLGAYGSTHVYTWADSYESAEEEMLEWVDDHAPGLLHQVETEEDEVDMIMVGHTTLEHGNAIPSWEVHVREVTGDTRKRAIATSKAICEREDAPNLPALQANRSGIAPLVVGALVAGGLAWWFLKSKEAKASTPIKQACPITEAMLQSFIKQKNYGLYWPKTETRPASQWAKPNPADFAPNTRVFSSADCGFYKWNGTVWVVDDATNAEFAKFVNASVVKGTPALNGHPAGLFLF